MISSQTNQSPFAIMKSSSSPSSLLGAGAYFLGNNKVGSSFLSQHQQPNPSSNQILPTTERRVRNSGSLLFMLAFLGFLAYVVWDGIFIKETDIDLIVHGHDSYGNICGRQNKPIKFVEKSGKNFTSKPYTKYTLINAQFERYILDPQRLKYGELLYVKQDGSPARVGAASKPALVEELGSQASRIAAAINKNRSRIRRSGGAVTFPGSRASDYGTLHESRKQLYGLTNQTALNNLKSTLMYQYPPMHGYQSPAPQAAKRGGLIYAADDRGALRAEASLLSSAVSAAPPVTATVSTTPSTKLSSTTMTVLFDDQTEEHMLIDTTSINLKPRNFLPEVLNHNDVSNSLLYLTECVDQCPSDHTELIFYRCMPKNWRFSLFPNAINVTRTFIDDILTDISHCYRELIYIFSFALVLSIGLMILLRFLASLIIWSCLTILISLLLSMASYSWLSYYNQVIDLNNAMPHDSVYSEKLASSDKWLIGAIFLTFIALAAIALIIFMRRRILLVTTLFKESGKAIADMPLLLLQPLVTFAALVMITVVWSIGLICLQSMKLPVIDASTGFVVFKAETLYKIMKWYHIFAFLWVSHFAIACQHYVIGAAVSKWYFSTNRYNLHSPIGSSVSELILYYLGTVALGSFLVAVFKVVRIITRQIHYLVQRNCMTNPNSNSDGLANSEVVTTNPSQLSTSCCGTFSYVWRMFIWFFDNIVMIINRDAYVEVAIYGHSFLGGAQKAFSVLASNPLRLLAIKSVSNVLLIVAKICVVFGTISMATILLEEKNQQLNYSWSPIIISAVYAYVVAHWFLSVYEMVIDALFICYCEDHDQTARSQFMFQVLNSNSGPSEHIN